MGQPARRPALKPQQAHRPRKMTRSFHRGRRAGEGRAQRPSVPPSPSPLVLPPGAGPISTDSGKGGSCSACGWQIHAGGSCPSADSLRPEFLAQEGAPGEPDDAAEQTHEWQE